MPDKEARKKRLVVGLSGGLNSFVTAYLLKIQKYELIGITVVGNWENYKEDPSKVLACHLGQPQVDEIKKFCHQLGIPHIAIKSSDEFKEEVVESWTASRMSGQKPNPCWNCHELRMRLLHHKMIELEAQGIATGHLAKIFRQESHDSVYVHTSNDEAYDQSSLLSRLPHAILNKLMLPLSDLQQKEISKLAENFGLTFNDKKIKMHECLNQESVSPDYLLHNVPLKYFKSGEVFEGEGKTDKVMDHEGVNRYEYGKEVKVPNQRPNEHLFFSDFSFPDKRINLATADFFKKQTVFLNQCHVSEETPWIEPLRGVVKVNDHDYIDCWVYPKHISSAVVVLDSPQTIQEGEIVTVLKKSGKNAKVYLTGKARYIDEGPANIEEGKERVKVDHSRDF